jgi:hypothetical protein
MTPDDIDKTIQALESEWAQAADERKARELKEQRERLESNRQRLLNREWVPKCCCRSCLRACLTRNPALVCADAQRYGPRWW